MSRHIFDVYNIFMKSIVVLTLIAAVAFCALKDV